MVNSSLNKNGWVTVNEHLLKEAGEFSISFHLMTIDNEIIGATMIRALPDEMAKTMLADEDTYGILKSIQNIIDNAMIDYND